MSDVFKFFRLPGDTLGSFRTQWSALSDLDKAQLKTGVQDGSLTY